MRPHPPSLPYEKAGATECSRYIRFFGKIRIRVSQACLCHAVCTPEVGRISSELRGQRRPLSAPASCSARPMPSFDREALKVEKPLTCAGLSPVSIRLIHKNYDRRVMIFAGPFFSHRAIFFKKIFFDRPIAIWPSLKIFITCGCVISQKLFVSTPKNFSAHTLRSRHTDKRFFVLSVQKLLAKTFLL